jgi:hypothetical protein
MDQNIVPLALLRRAHSLLTSPESSISSVAVCDAAVLHDLFRELTTCTHASGMEAFAGLCLRVTEQLAQVARTGHVSARMLAVIQEWTELAVRYLAARGDACRAAPLVECFADRRWERRCDRAERAALLRELIASVPLMRSMPLPSHQGKFSNPR